MSAAFALGLVVLTSTDAEATRPSQLTVGPASVKAGESLNVDAFCVMGTAGSVSSAGFLGPVSFEASRGDLNDRHLHARATSRPGHYTAKLTCRETFGATASFEVLPGPTSTPTKPSKAGSQTTSPQPKTRKVPQGAPETGGGTE